MAVDAGYKLFVVPDPTAASATPATSNAGDLHTNNAVIGGFYVPEDMTLTEAGVTFTTAGTTTPLVWKLQLCRDTQIGNAADIVGVSPDGVAAGSALCTASSGTVAVGTTINKVYNVLLRKGDFVLATITTKTTAATGFFYAICYPCGEGKFSTKLQSTTTVSTLGSTT